MNQITISGHLSRAPECGTSQSGTDYARFSVAVSRGKDIETPDWFDVVVFNDLARFMSDAGKGDKVLVIGRMQSEKYIDNAGNKRTAWKLLANQAYRCLKGKRTEPAVDDPTEAPPVSSDPDDEPSDSGLPF